MENKTNRAVPYSHPGDAKNQDLSLPHFPKLQNFSLSGSDAKFFTNVTSHWFDAAIAGNSSKAETCSRLLAAFCLKFTLAGEGVSHE